MTTPKEKTILFVFEARCLRRAKVRDILRRVEFQNPGRIRWAEFKGWITSEFYADGDRKIIDLIEKLINE